MDLDPSVSAANDPELPPPPPLVTRQRPKSPPLAFEKTPNDSLLPLIQHSETDGEIAAQATMGRLSPSSLDELNLQIIVDQQASAMQLLHEAFSAERQVWFLEKERLYQRISSLEKLLKTGDHWSPAKSPILSPSSSSNIMSPQARAINGSSSLPTISEDDRSLPLSMRRDGAPTSIDISILTPTEERGSSVSFMDASGMKIEEIPPPVRSTVLSPPPHNNRMMAGHTPIKAPRPPTPPPQKMSFDSIEDTPTRNNTHINTLLTQSSDEEEDAELKGPLNMPELPNQPDASNFTLEMLSKKLELIERNPDQAKPLVFSERTPGLASPVSELAVDDAGPSILVNAIEAPVAPKNTRNANASNQSSTGISPLVTTPGGSSVPKGLHDAKLHSDFEQGGIKLKKKASINFGAPFGQLSGFGRKLS